MNLVVMPKLSSTIQPKFFNFFLIYVLFYLGRLNFGALIPLIKEVHGFTNFSLGLVASSMLFMYTLMQIPSGYFADKIGPKKMLIFGCLLIATGNVMMCTWLYPLMILAQIINGWGQSTGWSSLVKLGYKKDVESKKVLGVLSSAVPAGTSFAYVFAGFTAERITLNIAFLLPAMIMLLLAIAIYFYISDNNMNFEILTSKISIDNILKHNIVLLSCIQASILSVMNSLFVWLPTIFVDICKVSPLEAYKFAFFFPLPGILGGLLGSYFTAKYGNKPSIIVNQAILTLLTLLILFFVDPTSSNFLIFYLLLLTMALFFRFGSPSLFDLAIKTVGINLAGTTSGFLNFVGSVGSALTTALIGLILDYYPTYTIFYLFIIIFILSFFISLLLKDVH